jgi:RNA polymerase sigma-70 factor (ECF subfamily)
MGETIVKEASTEFRSALVDCIPHLRAVAISLTRNGDRADDLVHDAAVRALAATHQFTPGTNFKAWIFTILRNHHYNESRKEQWLSFDEEKTITGQANPATQEIAVELDELRRTLWRLGAGHREVLMLIGATGLSQEEAAKVCNCAIGTIKSRLSRARRELARLTAEGVIDFSYGGAAQVAQMA